jgi:signal transduction histidine kinase/DNA-binding response OmpR family regulator
MQSENGFVNSRLASHYNREARINIIAAAISCVLLYLLIRFLEKPSAANYFLRIFTASLVIATPPCLYFEKRFRFNLPRYQWLCTFYYVGGFAIYMYMQAVDPLLSNVMLASVMLFSASLGAILTCPLGKRVIVFSTALYFVMVGVAISPLLSEAIGSWLLVAGTCFGFAAWLRVKQQQHLADGARQQFKLQKATSLADLAKIESEKVLNEIRAIESEARYDAITKTAQMLAHDVRKPLNVVEVLANSLEHESDPNRTKQIVEKFLPDIKRSQKNALRLVADVLEFGGVSEPFREEQSLEPLLLEAFTEVFIDKPSSEIEFRYNLHHGFSIPCDQSRILRVFINIIDNANVAMGGSGVIEISSRDLEMNGTKYLGIDFKNTNSYISPEDLPHVFDAFFSKHKKHGTGLGLTICKKIIEAHGGTIHCQSTQASGTAFTIYLPVANPSAATSVILPSSSKEISQKWRREKDLPGDNAIRKIRLDELTREKSLALQLEKHQGRFSIAIIDDEKLYPEAIQSQIGSLKLIADRIEVKTIESPALALNLIERLKPQLVICDIDFGIETLDGFDLVRTLRDRGETMKICIHSSQTSTEAFQRAMRVGANAFLPKPMSRAQLLALIHECLPQSPTAKVTSKSLRSARDTKIAVIDDDPFILDEWYKGLIDADVIAFLTPEAFLERLKHDKPFATSLAGVISDYIFENGSGYDGYSLAEAAKKFVDCPVIIASNYAFGSRDYPTWVDAQVVKKPQSWLSLKTLIASKKHVS